MLQASAESGGADRAILQLTANEATYSPSVAVPPEWSLAPQGFKNARSLVRGGAAGSDTGRAEVQVYVEPRADHADALTQIREATSATAALDRLVTAIGGWPAVRTEDLLELPQPSQGMPYSDPKVWRMQAHIAVGDTLFVITGTLPQDADATLRQTVSDIISSLDFGSASEGAALERDLDILRSEPATKTDALLDTAIASTGSSERLGIAASAGPNASPPGAVVEDNIRINTNGRGELEIATSADGLDVVVALQSRRFVSSNDGGMTFTNAGTVGAGNGDPSVARGASGDFYLAWIDTGCGSTYSTFDVTTQPAQSFGYDCTGIARSTNGGVSFQTNTVNPAVVCVGRAPSGGMDPAGACFPDQEHIAADPVTAGGGGGDQIYSTWRNFNSANQDAGLVCSQDSGVNWTAPITLGADSFFPRISVGQDGFVYVAAYSNANYRLWKFSSCAAGLALQAGFPVNVAARTPYACPFAGHDRCDQNPSSQTVAVDDTDPNHLYYAYAQDDAEATHSYSTVFVRDSQDGGATWPAARVVAAHAATNARRIMPWLCTTQGDAVVTWYEQAAPVPSDSTHHVGAQVGLASGHLTAKAGFTISEVPDNWCDSGWPCGTRVAPGASESCPNQPQLAGICIDGAGNNTGRCDFSDCGGVGANGGGACQCGATSTCNAGNGCPKYGDYNGNACVGGRLHAAWPSAASPPGVPGPDTATNTGVLYSFVAVNGPPVCDANGPYTAECGLATSLDGSGSYDPEGQSFDFTWTGPFEVSPASGGTPSVIFPTPTGAKLVNLVVEDTDGLTAACVANVTVQDTLDPTLTVPGDITAECTSPAGTPVDVGSAIVSDVCDPAVAVSNDAPALFPLGDTTVTWIATDDDSNKAEDTQTITIEDTTPPVIACNSPPTITPPDAPIAFTAMAEDVCEGPIAAQVTEFDCFTFTKNGRRIDKTNSCVVSFTGDTLTIHDSGGVGDNIEWTVTATDGSGNTATKVCSLVVANPGQKN